MTSIDIEKKLPHTKAIDVTVNRKNVRLRGAKQTGLSIKEAAIAQGVAIQLDFQLSLRTGKRWVVLADTDTVTVTEHSEFRAVDSDDNS